MSGAAPGQRGVRSKFIRSPSEVTQPQSKFESKRNDVNGAGDNDVFRCFYNFTDSQKKEEAASRRSSAVKVAASRTSIASVVVRRREGKHFEELKQRLKVNTKNRDFQRKLREHKKRKDMQQLEMRIDRLISAIDSRVSGEAKSALVKVDASAPAHQRRISIQIFYFIAVLIVYPIALAYFVGDGFQSKPERSMFALFSPSSSPDTDRFSFFSKLLRK